MRAAAGGAPVRLTGYLSDARLDALMRGADALVHPSLYEGFGLVLVEAMARGVPVVAARATALPETGGDAAEYFDPLDVGDMAAAIRRVVGDRERHAELARRGRDAGAPPVVGVERGADGGRVRRDAVSARTTILVLSVDEAHLLEHSLPAAAAQPGAELVVDRQRLHRRHALGRRARGRAADQPARARVLRGGDQRRDRRDRGRRGAAAQRRLRARRGLSRRGAAAPGGARASARSRRGSCGRRGCGAATASTGSTPRGW